MRLYKYNQFGNYAIELPDENEVAQLIQYVLSFTQQAIERGEIIKPDWLVLDSFSTISSFRNQGLLQSVNTCNTNEELCVYINSGYLDYDIMGTFKYLQLHVFYNSSAIEKILSMEDITEKFSIIMDTDAERAMVVHINAKDFLKFT